MKKLLEIVVAEYQQMTGLNNVSEDTKIVNKHIVPLKKRLCVRHDLLILKSAKLETIRDFVVAVNEGTVALGNCITEVLQIVEQIVGCAYSSDDILFHNFEAEHWCQYRYRLYKEIRKRYGVKFDEQFTDLLTAKDFAKYIFKRINVDKTLV